MTRPKPVVLCILDGWGHRAETDNNAIALADTPTWDRLVETCPHALIDTSGEDVGLPAGQMGNSEVGHMNLGAGRVVMQDLPRIDRAIADGFLDDDPKLHRLIATLKDNGKTCHLMGLVSDGGVHSHQTHMAALARRVARDGVPVVLHAFLDGRDTPPRSAKTYLRRLLDDVADLDRVTLGTVSGRYYAMDRDKRWDRVSKAYAALTVAKGARAADAESAIERSYADGKSDEFVLPTVIDDYRGMGDGDTLVMANFRADRAREILMALACADFHGFERDRIVDFSARLGMVEYSKTLAGCMEALFPPEELTNIFGEIVSRAGLTQLRIAETEKYAHVTFFFNGGEEAQYDGEERILVPSPKVATYDEKPEMSAPEVTDKLVEAIENERFDVIIVNYANGDMVGHTGILSAAIKAAETIDGCLARLEKAIVDAGGVMLVTADHGNCELMQDPNSGEPHTAHTSWEVPAVLVNPPAGVEALGDGRLADVAPTLLTLLDLPQPAEMTGHSLLIEKRARATG